MSKLGKKTINIPKGISIKIDPNKLVLNGPNGTQEVLINEKLLSANLSNENILSIKPKTKSIDDDTKRIWGMTRSLVDNAVHGVNKGYEKILEMTGVGFRASLKENKLVLQLGFSHNVEYLIPKGIKIVVEKQSTIKINGNDKALVGKVASEIKFFKPTEPYKGKGIKEKGQYILRKEGKKK